MIGKLIRRTAAVVLGAAAFSGIAFAGMQITPIADASTPAPARFACRYGSPTDDRVWSFVANVPSGYVIGNCRDGWHFDRQVKFVNPHTHNAWDGGYFRGHYDGCGWIDASNDKKVDGRPGAACQSASRNPAEFARLINCKPGTCGDGAPVTVIKKCREYANVRPWSDKAKPTDLLRTRDKGYGNLQWRYQSRNGQWVMVHDTGDDVGPGRGNWSFVSRSCLGALNPRHGEALYQP